LSQPELTEQAGCGITDCLVGIHTCTCICTQLLSCSYSFGLFLQFRPTFACCDCRRL